MSSAASDVYKRQVSFFSAVPFMNKQPSDFFALVLLPRTSTRNVLQELQLSRELLGEQGKSVFVFLGWVISGIRAG